MFIKSTAGETATLYLDLLKQCLTDTLRRPQEWMATEVPEHAETMLGMNRVENIQFCLEDALAAGVPGDFVETGVWRGGACVFARAILRVHGVTDRRVWVADSFQGLPPPNATRFPADAGDPHYRFDNLRISREQVEASFRRYRLFDDQVVFLEGFFSDTLPTAPIGQIAVLRLDGDMYESTIVALESLYDRVPPGGYVIVDDLSLPPCARAVEDFRRARGIADPIWNVDWTGAFWRKHAGMPPPPGVEPLIWPRQLAGGLALCDDALEALAAGDAATARQRLEQVMRRTPALSEVRWMLERLHARERGDQPGPV